MKLKNYFFLILALSILSCEVYKIDDDACEVFGNYYFRYIDKTSVSFCGWTRDAIDKLGGDMYVPEKIYNLKVVEIRAVDKVKNKSNKYGSGYSYTKIDDYMKGVKSIFVPETVKIIQDKTLDAWSDVEKVTFKETSNWYAKDASNAWTPVDVSNPSLNVSKIKALGTLKHISH